VEANENTKRNRSLNAGEFTNTKRERRIIELKVAKQKQSKSNVSDSEVFATPTKDEERARERQEPELFQSYKSRAFERLKWPNRPTLRQLTRKSVETKMLFKARANHDRKTTKVQPRKTE
jgi:hypothetical protein